MCHHLQIGPQRAGLEADSLSPCRGPAASATLIYDGDAGAPNPQLPTCTHYVVSSLSAVRRHRLFGMDGRHVVATLCILGGPQPRREKLDVAASDFASWLVGPGPRPAGVLKALGLSTDLFAHLQLMCITFSSAAAAGDCLPPRARSLFDTITLLCVVVKCQFMPRLVPTPTPPRPPWWPIRRHKWELSLSSPSL